MTEPMATGLRSAIRASGITQEELARLAGVRPATISDFLHGKQSVTLTTADRIARVLGIEVTFGKGGLSSR